jgi:hypothetical protein
MAGALGPQGLVRVEPIRFIEGELRHSTDRWAGRPFRLRGFQREFLAELFKERRGHRVYTRGLLGLPKKNGKSELLAAIGAKLLVADAVYGAEVISCAGDRAQARIVFDVAKRMVQFSPRLSATLKIFPRRDRGPEHRLRLASRLLGRAAASRPATVRGPVRRGARPAEPRAVGHARGRRCLAHRTADDRYLDGRLRPRLAPR